MLLRVRQFAVPALCCNIYAKFAKKERGLNFSDLIVSKTFPLHPILCLSVLVNIYGSGSQELNSEKSYVFLYGKKSVSA